MGLTGTDGDDAVNDVFHDDDDDVAFLEMIGVDVVVAVAVDQVAVAHFLVVVWKYLTHLLPQLRQRQQLDAAIPIDLHRQWCCRVDHKDLLKLDQQR